MPERRFQLQLLLSLIGRDLKVRYEKSILGFLWALLQPVATFAIYYFVFSIVIRMKIPDYWAFLLSGLMLWQFISASLNSATNCIHGNRSLLRKMPLPTENFVFGVVGSRAAEFMIELTIGLTLFGIFLGTPVWKVLPFLLVTVALAALFTAGLALPIAAGSVYFADLGHAVPIALRLLFFICPIFYTRHSVPEKYRLFYTLNPINVYLDNFRRLVFEGVIPSWDQFLWMGVLALAAFAIGTFVFRRSSRYFAEIL